MIIQKYKTKENGLLEQLKSYETNDITDIVKEYMLLNNLDKEEIAVREFGSEKMDIMIDSIKLVFFDTTEDAAALIGSKDIKDIKNLPKFLSVLETNPTIGGIKAIDILLEE